jgi:hypothetical protein
MEDPVVQTPEKEIKKKKSLNSYLGTVITPAIIGREISKVLIDKEFNKRIKEEISPMKEKIVELSKLRKTRKLSDEETEEEKHLRKTMSELGRKILHFGQESTIILSVFVESMLRDMIQYVIEKSIENGLEKRKLICKKFFSDEVFRKKLSYKFINFLPSFRSLVYGASDLIEEEVDIGNEDETSVDEEKPAKRSPKSYQFKSIIKRIKNELIEQTKRDETDKGSRFEGDVYAFFGSIITEFLAYIGQVLKNMHAKIPKFQNTIKDKQIFNILRTINSMYPFEDEKFESIFQSIDDKRKLFKNRSIEQRRQTKKREETTTIPLEDPSQPSKVSTIVSKIDQASSESPIAPPPTLKIIKKKKTTSKASTSK